MVRNIDNEDGHSLDYKTMKTNEQIARGKVILNNPDYTWIWQQAQKELLEELIEENTSNNRDLGEIIVEKWRSLTNN